MHIAKLFKNGRSQAVRLPKEYNFKGNEVLIQKVGGAVILFPKDRAWETFMHGLNGFTDDFLAHGREQPEMQEREGM
jgi:antitoxin VapB